MSEPAKIRILDSAERLFARNGFEATSLRAIIVEARVNLASVHYYYRSKEGLIRAVIERRFAPINQERLRLLEECQQTAGDRTPSVEQILEAFLLPMVSIGMKKSKSNSYLMQLGGRILLESGASFEHLYWNCESRQASEGLANLAGRSSYWLKNQDHDAVAHNPSTPPES